MDIASQLAARKAEREGAKSVPPEPLLISRKDLAARWHVHPNTIRRMEKTGELVPLVIGKKLIRYYLDKVIEIEQMGKTRSQPTI